MPLPSGSRLGPYELIALLGAGGMGEVYRARDSKLGREVAIKVLPAAFLTDADRSMRFEREARLLASLNHPNIATIHGVEEASGVTALVMELVEGDPLAERPSRSNRRSPQHRAADCRRCAPSGRARRCLDKDGKRRLRDIGDARIELDGAITKPAARDAGVGRPAPGPL